MSQLTLSQQAQIAAVVGQRPDTEVLSVMHYAYCVTKNPNNMICDDDEAYFDEKDIDTKAADFDIFAHGELCCTGHWKAFKAISDDIEAVIAYAWRLALAIKANDPTEHPNIRQRCVSKLEELDAVM
jgi:hypothetical protein